MKTPWTPEVVVRWTSDGVMDCVTYDDGFMEIELPYVYEVRRTCKNAELPLVEIVINARLVEHFDPRAAEAPVSA